MTIAPRLVLQAIRLVGVDRGRISVPFTTRWHQFASLPALLLQPRTVIAPIALFVGAMITPRLILQSPSVFRVDIASRVRTTDFKLSAEAGYPTAIATALTARIRQTTIVRTSPSKGCWDYLTGWDNGRAADFFHPSPRRDLNRGFALFADMPARPVGVTSDHELTPQRVGSDQQGGVPSVRPSSIGNRPAISATNDDGRLRVIDCRVTHRCRLPEVGRRPNRNTYKSEK